MQTNNIQKPWKTRIMEENQNLYETLQPILENGWNPKMNLLIKVKQ